MRVARVLVQMHTHPWLQTAMVSDSTAESTTGNGTRRMRIVGSCLSMVQPPTFEDAVGTGGNRAIHAPGLLLAFSCRKKCPVGGAQTGKMDLELLLAGLQKRAENR